VNAESKTDNNITCALRLKIPAAADPAALPWHSLPSPPAKALTAQRNTVPAAKQQAGRAASNHSLNKIKNFSLKGNHDPHGDPSSQFP
jgi:hypothetical protein